MSTSPPRRHIKDVSEVQVPFRTLTKEEAKAFSKSWEDIKKAHDETLK